MQVIRLETRIAAPPDRCFLLSLSVDLHMASTDQSGERAVAGVTHGLIGLGQTVTWQGRHFGFMLEHETLITGYDRPRYFQDVMVKGMFRVFEHDHHFELFENGGTNMRDELRFAAPFGALGWLTEKIVLPRYMIRFLEKRNLVIRTIVQSPEGVWAPFLKETE